MRKIIPIEVCLQFKLWSVCPVLLILCFLTVFGSEANANGDSTPMTIQAADAQREYEQDISRLEPFNRSTDISGLEKLADELNEKWSKGDTSHHAALMLEIAQMFDSNDFGFSNSGEQQVLAQKYAKLGLQKSTEIPVRMEARLVARLVDDLEYRKGAVVGEEWAKLRLQKSKLWLHAMERVQKEIDLKFDFKGYQQYVSPPRGYENMMTPVPPEAIADPKVRAEYEAAIEKNKQLLQKIREQNSLRGLEKTFSPVAEDYLIAAYSKPSHNLEELQHLLGAYDIGAERKARILAAVKKNTGVVDEAPKKPAAAPPTPDPKTPQKPAARKPG